MKPSALPETPDRARVAAHARPVRDDRDWVRLGTQGWRLTLYKTIMFVFRCGPFITQ